MSYYCLIFQKTELEQADFSKGSQLALGPWFMKLLVVVEVFSPFVKDLLCVCLLVPSHLWPESSLRAYVVSPVAPAQCRQHQIPGA